MAELIAPRRRCASVFLKLLSFLAVGALGALAIYSNLSWKVLEGSTADSSETNTVVIAGVPVHNYPRQSAANQFRRLRGTTFWGGIHDWILEFKDNATDHSIHEVCTTLSTSHAKCLFEGHPSSGGVPMLGLRATEEELKSILQTYGDVLEFAEADSEMHATDVPWGLDRIDARSGLDGSYSSNATGKGVHVYVTDTGIRTTHQDFKSADGKTSRAVPTLDLTSGEVKECSSSDTECAADRQGHGTHCAGSIGGKNYGVAKETTLHAVKVLSDKGSGQWSWFVQALDWVAINGQHPAIVSASLGGGGQNQAVKTAVQKAVKAGVTVIVAAGNSGADACRFSPAFVPEAITVGATSHDDKKASWSNYGSCMDIFAPGVDILSAGIKSDTASRSLSGTSMAAPHVAGAAALILESDKSLSPADVEAKLRIRATPYVVKNAGQESDNLLLYIGDSPTMSTTTTTVPVTTTTQLVFGDRSWVVTEGPCTIDAEGCAMTQGSTYGNNEFCRILVNPDETHTGPISVLKFRTELGYDILTVNGKAYAGISGPQDITPRGEITWRSDRSETYPGWRMCMRGGQTVTTTTTTTTTMVGVTIQNEGSDSCLKSQGARTLLTENGDGSCTKFTIEGKAFKSNDVQGNCLDWFGGRGWGLWNCHGGANQQFVHSGSGKWCSGQNCVIVSGGDITTTSGTTTTTMTTTTTTTMTTTTTTTTTMTTTITTTMTATTTSTTPRLIEGLTPEQSAVYNPHLASFWDHNVCEKLGKQLGDNHNWNWCGTFQFDCARSVSVNSTLCSSGVAELNFTRRFAKIDGCAHAYFAQYVCKLEN